MPRRRSHTRRSPHASAERHDRPDRPWLFVGLLWIATFLAYQPAWHGGVLWDDIGHLTRLDLRPLSGLWRIWFEIGATQQYYPVAHSTWWVLHRLWGDNLLGYHFFNIALHATSACLVAVILRRLEVPGARLAAVIFALHPIQVESVAWMTEMKNTLSGTCYFLAALAYLRFDRSRSRSAYAVACAFFLLALLTKTVTATLPAALLVVLWWQRGRLEWTRDVRPLMPLFMVGAAGGLMTVWFEHALIGARGAAFDYGPIERLLIAGRVVWFYLGKLAWPHPLIFVYPRWQVSSAVWWQYLFPVALGAILFLAWRMRERSRAPLAALLLFCGTLVPALGFVNVYPFRFSFVADHFQYLASVFPIALASAGLVTALQRWRPSLPEPALAATIALPLALLSWQESHEYVTAEGLFNVTLADNPGCWMCHDNLAVAALDEKRPADALPHLRESIRLNPSSAEAHYNLASATSMLNRPEETRTALLEAIRLSPNFAAAHQSLGALYQAMGRTEQAIAELRQAISLTRRPAELAVAHYNLGVTLAEAGRFEEALPEFQQSLRHKPDSASARYELGYVRVELGRVSEGLPDLEEAVRLDPTSVEFRDALGRVLSEAGRHDQAVLQLREAVRLAPNSAEQQNNLGSALIAAGRLDEAETSFRDALRLNPQAVMVLTNLGRVLAATSRRTEAIQTYREALRLEPGNADAREGLQELSVRP